MISPAILSSIDLPFDSEGGSIELFKDLYLARDAPFHGRFFMFPPAADAWRPSTLEILSATAQRGDFQKYVAQLELGIVTSLAGWTPDALHLQHVAFGASLALVRAFPDCPALALVHGTDLIAAIESADQLKVLEEIIERASAIIVPTEAMGALLRALVNPTRLPAVTVIPWGIPTRAFVRGSYRTVRARGRFRFLFAGRLSPEKGFANLLVADTTGKARIFVTASKEALRSIAADPGGYVPIGWLPRQELWRRFASFDALLVPSVSVEAFGLTAIEAQASGLAVLYQPTSGLLETIGDSGIAVDFTSGGLAHFLDQNPNKIASLLADARDRGFRNATRYTMTRMAAGLATITNEIIDGHPVRSE